MKAFLCSALLLGATTIASADIPVPHNPAAQTESTSSTFSGTRAQTAFNSITSEEQPGTTTLCESSSYKVSRSDDGLTQLVCSASDNRCGHPGTQFSCTKEESTNGQPLPKFVPVRVMG
jgi:hypothetical protein